MWKELSAASPDTDIHAVAKSQIYWSYLSMHFRGGRLAAPVDGHSTVLETSLALPTGVAKMTTEDWAINFQMLDELSPTPSADATGAFCCCLAVAWSMPAGICLCLLGGVTMWGPHHPVGPESPAEKVVPSSERGSQSLLWSGFERGEPHLQTSVGFLMLLWANPSAGD